MEMLFDYLQHDFSLLLAVTALSIAVAVAAMWVLAANLRRK